MKNFVFLIIIIFTLSLSSQKADRIELIKNQLELLAIDNNELDENLKLEFNINNVTLPNSC